MRIATWNVNSIKARLPNVIEWLREVNPDVVLLQELKAPEEAFPHLEIGDLGYNAAVLGQKTYNGVAILARDTLSVDESDVVRNIPGFDDPQQRVIAATVDGVRLRLRLNPGRPGYNVATLWATDRAGALTGVTASRLVVRMTDHEMGEAEVRLVPRADGSHVAGTGVVAMSGTYEIEAIVRRDGRDDVRATFPAIAYDASAIDEVVLAALRQAPTEARAVRNPLASTPESLDRGRTIYLQSCAACHGITG